MDDPDRILRPLEVERLGVVPYPEAEARQQELVAARREGRICDRLLLLEHPHVITLGTAGDRRHVLRTDEEIERAGGSIHEVGRGGDVTYHGPGQLVGYPILDLKPDRRDLHRYLRDLEGFLIDLLSSYGIVAFRSEGLTGVWTDGGKIAAIGVRVSSGWITSHGFALNVDPDPGWFASIVPCGIPDRPVTSMRSLLGEAPTIGDVCRRAAPLFARSFGRELIGDQSSGGAASMKS